MANLTKPDSHKQRKDQPSYSRPSPAAKTELIILLNIWNNTEHVVLAGEK